MDYYPDEASSASLIAAEGEDATTINTSASPYSSRSQKKYCGMFEHCDCSSPSCQSQELQLSSKNKTIYESWTMTYHRTALIETQPNLPRRIRWLTREREPGHVMAIEPKTHFDQKELARVVSRIREQHKPWTFSWSGSYDDEVESRLRKLALPVQNELYRLLQDRTRNSSNAFRRREYKLVVLVEVPGGDMTDAGSRIPGDERWIDRLRKRRRLKAPHVEYRVILRGDEVARNDAGWGVYDRYSQPWKIADKVELASVRENNRYQKILD